MAWNVHIGQSAPGLGVVIDMKQRMPNYDENIRYSGINGYLVLIVRTGKDILAESHRFIIATWDYGDEEPKVETALFNLDAAYRLWKQYTLAM